MRSIFVEVPKIISIFRQQLGSRVYVIFLFSAAAGVADGAGIMLLLPLLEMMTESQEHSLISDVFLGLFGYLQIQPSVSNILAVMALIFILKGVCLFLFLDSVAVFRGDMLLSLKSKLLNLYLRAKFSDLSALPAGHINNLAGEQVNRSLLAFLSVCQLVSHLVNAVIYTLLAFLVTWKFGVMAVALGVLLLYLFRALNQRLSGISLLMVQVSRDFQGLLIEFSKGLKYFKATNSAKFLGDKVQLKILDLKKYEIANGRAAAFTQSIREPIAVIFVTAIVLIQILILDASIEPILVSIVLFYRGLNSVLQIQGYWQNTLQYSGAVTLIADEISLLEESDNQSTTLAGIGDGPTENIQSIQLDAVSLSYGSGNDILKNISFTFNARNSYAIVGPSGAGKSTLADLLCLLHEPTKGSLLVNGREPAASERYRFRAVVGYVPQDPVIIEETLLQNILMGRPHDDLLLQECLEDAGLSELVASMENGFDTLVGDSGFSLSGGQRQRLAIARELYRRPQVLILDEATSALDADTEQTIVRSVARLAGRVTTVVIAHRLTCIQSVGTVLVMVGGELVETGSYSHLSKDSSSRLYSMIHQPSS